MRNRIFFFSFDHLYTNDLETISHKIFSRSFLTNSDVNFTHFSVYHFSSILAVEENDSEVEGVMFEMNSHVFKEFCKRHRIKYKKGTAKYKDQEYEVYYDNRMYVHIVTPSEKYLFDFIKFSTMYHLSFDWTNEILRKVNESSYSINPRILFSYLKLKMSNILSRYFAIKA